MWKKVDWHEKDMMKWVWILCDPRKMEKKNGDINRMIALSLIHFISTFNVRTLALELIRFFLFFCLLYIELIYKSFSCYNILKDVLFYFNITNSFTWYIMDFCYTIIKRCFILQNSFSRALWNVLVEKKLLKSFEMGLYKKLVCFL